MKNNFFMLFTLTFSMLFTSIGTLASSIQCSDLCKSSYGSYPLDTPVSCELNDSMPALQQCGIAQGNSVYNTSTTSNTPAIFRITNNSPYTQGIQIQYFKKCALNKEPKQALINRRLSPGATDTVAVKTNCSVQNDLKYYGSYGYYLFGEIDINSFATNRKNPIMPTSKSAPIIISRELN